MKVLQINSVCGIKSTGRICTSLADMLTEEGHSCRIAYGRENVPEQYEPYALRIGCDRGVMCHALSSRILDNAGFGSRRATKKLIDDIRAYDPDVIHLHNLHGYYLNLEVLFTYLKTCGKKIIWTLHDCWGFTGHCAHFSYAGCDKWQSGCHHCSQKNAYPVCYGLDSSAKNFRRKKELFTGISNLTLVIPSKWLADLVEQSFLKEYPVRVIHNGVDLNVFKPTPSDFKERLGLENKTVVLGVASVWDRRKGLDDFIKLSTMLDDSYRIVLVGLTDKQIKALPKNIIGITRTNSTRELAALYTMADVFVNPSVEETFGLVTVEALACGTPVVVYNQTAVPEAVDDTCGIVTVAGELIQLKAALQTCLQAGFTRQNCLNRARQYEINDRFDQYLELYSAASGRCN